jgi:Conserved TM helix
MMIQVATTIQDTGDALRASLAGALGTFLSAVPRIIGFVLVLLIGWFIASLLAKAVAALLHAVKFNDLARRSGFADFVHNMGVKTDSAGVIASVAKWFVRLIVMVVAFDMLGLPAVSQVLRELLLWLPNLVVALVVLVIAGLAATALSNLVRGATAQAGLSSSDTLATIAKVAVWAFGIVVAVNQLGIATTLINTLLIGVVGALALATGLAFGLGGRDRAAQMIERASQKAEQAAPKLAEAASNAKEQASAGAGTSKRRQPWTGVEQRIGDDAKYQGPERRLALA